MNGRRALLALAIAVGAACGRDERTSFVIPGPTAPSTVPTAAPFVWDSREELGDWLNNGVTRGAVSLDGSGQDAVIRVDRQESEWVLRGPDLSPTATGVRSARLRYRWRLDSTASSTSRTIYVVVYFDAPLGLPDYQRGQASTSQLLQPSEGFTEATFTLGQYIPALDVRYFYISSTSANRGVLEIDRIELGR